MALSPSLSLYECGMYVYVMGECVVCVCECAKQYTNSQGSALRNWSRPFYLVLGTGCPFCPVTAHIHQASWSQDLLGNSPAFSPHFFEDGWDYRSMLLGFM